MTSVMPLPMIGFISALSAASPSLVYHSDTFDPINNPPPADAKDRALQEAEELDALQQLNDFLTHYSAYRDDSDDEQWRYRVLIRDLIDEGPVFVPDQDTSSDETASTFSDETSNTSIRVFLGSQVKTVPTGWRATSTPKRAPTINEMTSDFPSSNLASPECSPLSISAEISQDSLPSKIRLSGIEENDEKEAVLEPVISAQSPTSEPSPTPKITASTPTGFSISPDTSGSSTSFMDSSFPNHPKHAASILLLPPAPSHQQQPRRREEKPHVLPMSHRLSPTLSNVKVLKITNLPWSITSEDLLQWLGNDVKNSLIPIDNQIVSVHILCDRSKCRTKCPAYVEITSNEVVRDVIKRLNKQEYQGRNIRITVAPRKELLAAIFPTWAQNGLSTTSKVPIITSTELEGLVELCKLKTSFAKSTPERPYMNLLSIAAKYPWQSVDLLNSGNEEQAVVLQAIRDGHKHLNQHGKRLANYATLKHLFTNFLEKHGGVSGNLRPIPVSSPAFVAPSCIASTLPSSRRPRISQTLLDLLSANKQENTTSGKMAKEDHSGLIDSNTPDFVPAVAKERAKALEGAPCKKESIYNLPSHLPPTPRSRVFPSTPPKPDHIKFPAESSSNTSCLDSDLCAQQGVSPKSGNSNIKEKPTYAKVASNFDLSPEIIEKIAKVEKLFTPIRIQFSKESTSLPVQEEGCNPYDQSRLQSICVQKDDLSSHSTGKGSEESTEPTLLKQMADELGVDVETIKAIVKKLGALL